MKREGDVVRDWRALSLVVLALVVMIFIANKHLEVRGEVDEVGILTRFIHSAILSFVGVNFGLFMMTMALSHQHAKLAEQALGTLLGAASGILLFGLIVESGLTVSGAAPDVGSQVVTGALRILVTDAAILLSFIAGFGILLTMITGRTTGDDPLLELESTSFESEEE
ncbi:MAG: hypothetical protein H8D82_00385 [Euryarchaeota archaeon]|nr:hypothetical protein [Euryarchaeota archaeon]